ncbi:hypothetical protein TWF703_008846 [Orbilia oligospora]|uniref:Uncharacterized protein n=1 Tax=Orbilia oligospora TaxID=2813651 RepID=A0A7C8JW88_ORBOL|nr:hypothetical protein TWF703_008846 [Orbilia oligospora]
MGGSPLWPRRIYQASLEGCEIPARGTANCVGKYEDGPEDTAISTATPALIQLEDSNNELGHQVELQLPRIEAQSQVEQVRKDEPISNLPEPKLKYDSLVEEYKILMEDYKILMEKKNYYRSSYHRYRRSYEDLDERYQKKKKELEAYRRECAAYHPQVDKDNKIQKSTLFTGARELLEIFGVKNFSQAQTGWSKDKTELKETQRQLSELQDELKQKEIQLFEAQDKLEQTSQQFFKLQDEVLGCVERFDPSFDSQVCQEFVQLNNSIGRLCKSKELKEIALQGNPLTDWSPHTLWEESVHPALSFTQYSLSETEKRLVLRQATWKFISERLFNRNSPLASFSGPIGDLASSFDFAKLFPDHDVNEDAGKWRSITVRQLDALQEAGDSRQNEKEFITQLINEFIVHIQENLANYKIEREGPYGTPSGPYLKRLREVFERAVRFSRLIMKERASFTVDSPHLGQMEYTRVEDDELTTAQGADIGVSDGDDTEVDLAGTIKLVGSPFLRKHGDGGGKNLDQNIIIVRAFVVIDIDPPLASPAPDPIEN